MRFNAKLPVKMNVVVPVTCEIATLERDDLWTAKNYKQNKVKQPFTIIKFSTFLLTINIKIQSNMNN